MFATRDNTDAESSQIRIGSLRLWVDHPIEGPTLVVAGHDVLGRTR